MEHNHPLELLPDSTSSPSHPGSSPQQASCVHQEEWDPSKGIANPSPTDVICGRGKMTVAHPGNRRFRRLVTEKKDAYQKARRRDEKTRITFELVQELRTGPEGGRFLLYDPKTKLWYDVGDEYAREKVSHSLRSRPNEQRRSKPKPRKKMVRKNQYSPALDGIVTQLISDQQALLKDMIDKETKREAAVEQEIHRAAAAARFQNQFSSP